MIWAKQDYKALVLGAISIRFFHLSCDIEILNCTAIEGTTIVSGTQISILRRYAREDVTIGSDLQPLFASTLEWMRGN